MSSEIKFGMKDLSSYANLDCSEGEERIHEVLANEVTMDGKALVTDVRVPGRDFVLQAKRWSSFVFCFFQVGGGVRAGVRVAVLQYQGGGKVSYEWKTLLCA